MSIRKKESLQKMQNAVVIQDGYIQVIWRGAQTAKKVRETNLDVLNAAQEFTSKHKPVYVLLSIHEHPVLPNLGGFREALKIFKAIKLNRIAVTGNLPPKLMALITSVMSSFNKEVEIKCFKDTQDELRWLLRKT